MPIFRAAVDDCAERLRGPLGLDLRSVLYPDESDAVASERLRLQVFQCIRQAGIYSWPDELLKELVQDCLGFLPSDGQLRIFR